MHFRNAVFPWVHLRQLLKRAERSDESSYTADRKEEFLIYYHQFFGKIWYPPQKKLIYTGDSCQCKQNYTWVGVKNQNDKWRKIKGKEVFSYLSLCIKEDEAKRCFNFYFFFALSLSYAALSSEISSHHSHSVSVYKHGFAHKHKTSFSWVPYFIWAL